MRGLLAIEPLYHQIIAGRKTQTRRSGGLRVVNFKPDLWHLEEFNGGVATFVFTSSKQRNPEHCVKEVCKPRYKIGEVLYLKEPVDQHVDSSKNLYYYDLSPDHEYRDRSRFKWPNKLYMGANAARAFIRITGIKCERLLDISDEDCIAEGIELLDEPHFYKNYKSNSTNSVPYPKLSFISLYKFANKMKDDDNIGNPWVWCYQFEYLKEI